MKKYWSSIEDFNGRTPGEENEFEEKDPVLGLFEDDFLKTSSSRRSFLKVFGFTLSSAAILSACKKPVQKAIPYVIQPLEINPGQSLYYASTYWDGKEYSSILVKTREGRPIKIEPNDLSKFNPKGSFVKVQASVLSLYDDARLKEPVMGGSPSNWEAMDKQVMSELGRINLSGGRIVLLTSTIISPTTRKLINEFGSKFGNFRWVQYDPVSYSAIREANELCFGRAVFPDYHFQNASLVVSVNADFIGTWGSPVHFVPKYTSRRTLHGNEKSMLRHIHFESGMTLTGCNADERIRIKPSEERILLTDLYNRLSSKQGSPAIPGGKFREDLSGLAETCPAWGRA
jgi:molybdopterin-containing oxidoreductase family iron-sulfur binding subunit